MLTDKLDQQPIAINPIPDRVERSIVSNVLLCITTTAKGQTSHDLIKCISKLTVGGSFS